MPIILLLFYLASIVLRNVHGDTEHEIPRKSILSRRAIDGTRGRKYFDPEEEGSFDSYGSAGGQYDPYKDKQDHNDIRMNVPGEPGVDYPAYTILPQTGFSCEGRSRGYYADEVAGCQVFHVCHDILVSSFLCPIGSIFSQKLLTCDWWSKVDCSMTRKFIEINNDDYNQEDDDELIRKAYGMMGLRTDVTSDELVDPDRGGKIIDRDVTIKSTVNDLPNYRIQLPRFMTDPRFLPDYDEQSVKSSTSTSYKNSFYDKSHRARTQSSYQDDSPIVHIRRIGEEGYREGIKYSHNKFGQIFDEFQPSYAPTVPTVTTTTRRFYSPTIPTTYRPSTLAYNMFDQTIASSDHLYSHSKHPRNFLVTPTYTEKESRISTKRNYNDSNIDYHDESNNYHVQTENIDDDDRLKNFFNGNPFRNVHLDARNLTESNINVDKYSDDIETKESIGLIRAFNGTKFRIHVQDPQDISRRENDKKRGPNPTNIINLFNLTKSFIENDGRSTSLRETTMPINYDGSTPLVEYSSFPSKVNDRRTEIEELFTTTSSYDGNTETNLTIEEDHSSTTKISKSFNESSDSIGESEIINNPSYSIVLQPDIVLQPPPAVNPSTSFRINVQNLSTTTRIPVLPAHYITYRRDELQTSTELPRDERLSERRSTSSDLPTSLGTTKKSPNEETARSSISDVLINLFKDTSGRQEDSKFVILPNGSDFLYRDSTIDPFISQEENDRKNSFPVKSDQIEIVKSIEGFSNHETTIGSQFINETIEEDIRHDTNDSSGQNKSENDNSASGNANSLSLLQLMAELFKIDNIPRPFSLNTFQTVNTEYEYRDRKEIRNIVESTSIIPVIYNDNLPITRDNLNETITTRNFLKDRGIEFDELEEIDRPLYDTKNGESIYQLPHVQRSFNFKNSEDLEKESLKSFTISTSTSSPTTTTTESVKTIVETEFVPSIGFSFDTNEGRQKYIDAVLDGLLFEPIYHKSEINETANVETKESSSTNRSST